MSILDICFSDSFSGVLIQHNGSRSSVACLDMHLDIGDLSEGVFSDARKTAVNALYNDPWLYGEDLFDEKFWKEDIKTLNRIKKHAKNNGSLCVWYSMDVRDMCAFMFLMSELRDIPCNLSGICLQACPNWLAYTDGAWAALSPHEVDEFLPYEREISTMEKELYANKWAKIASQHWELRTFLNGSVTGIPTDFFDNLLLSFIPEGEFRMMDVLGNLLASTSGAAQYDFWHMRLTKLLHTDQFEMTRDYSNKDDQNPPLYKMWFRSRIPVTPCVQPSWKDEIMRHYGAIDSNGRYIPEANTSAVLDEVRKEYPNLYCGVCDHPHWGYILEVKENKESNQFKHRFRVEHSEGD